MDIVDRIFDLVQEKHLEQKEFAKLVGVAPSKVSEWKKRKSASYVKRLEIISKELDTTPQYLLYGNESDKKAPTTEAEKISKAATPEGSGLTDEFARIFAQLTPENQNRIIAEMLKRQRNQ